MESKEHTPAIVVTEIGDCISTWTVSYTHLDVYKRQQAVAFPCPIKGGYAPRWFITQ